MGKSIVSIAHGIEIEKAVEGALGALSGLEDLFKGTRTAIKPNETWASAEDRTACTQADTVRGAIRAIKRFSPSSITVSGGAGAGETDQIFSILGIDKVIREEGVEFFDHNRPPFEPVRLDFGPEREIMVSRRVLEYERLVSLAQLKVHNIATVTLSMKNIAMSYPAADYYGHPRSRRLKPHRFFDDMQDFIPGVCKRFPIALAIIAGHPAMTERGPIGGHTFETGLVITSTDFVSADAVGAFILGKEHVDHVEMAGRLGLGNAKLSDIEFRGLSIDEAARIFEGARSASKRKRA